jgi:hypothetical protein
MEEFKEFYKNPQLTEEGVKYVKSLSEDERYLILFELMNNHARGKDYHTEVKKPFLQNFKRELLYIKGMNQKGKDGESKFPSDLFKYIAELEEKHLGEMSKISTRYFNREI